MVFAASINSALGRAGLLLMLAASVFGALAVLYGIRQHDRKLLKQGPLYAWIAFGGIVLAVVMMQRALITRDFSLAYVQQVGSADTPALYNIAAMWSALEGSILLWALILAGFTAAVAWRFRKRTDDVLVAWALIVMFVVSAFFAMLSFGPADPFAAGAPGVTSGPGPNPLLQNHILVLFHPPILYLGYVGFTVPFAFAIAALVTGRLGEGWLMETRRWALFSWAFLTIGILLGGWWSYEVLGWSGVWAWDPVENASFLPWLTGTAYIHSVLVQERRGMLRVWNLSLVLATFSLTILGTFLTRSGVVDSVHAFVESSIGPALLGFLAVVALSGIGLIAWRGDRLRAPGRIDSPVSREAAFLANNLLFGAFALVVLLGTVFPLLAEALQDRQLSVGEPYFDRLGTPIGLALLFLMAVAPALPWRAASGELLRRRLIVPAWIGVATMVVALLLGADGVAQVLTFGLAGFALAGVARQFAVGIRARRRAHGESPPAALLGAVRGNPRLYGGLVVHVGVVLLAVGLAASAGYATKREVRLAPGETATVAGYDVTYLETVTDRSDQKVTVQARARLVRDGDDLGVYAPAISTFPNATGGIGTPSVRTGLFEDVYLTLVSSPTETGRVTLGIAVNPMVLWLWIGGAVMALGTVVALVPGRRTTAVHLPAATTAASAATGPADGGPADADRVAEPEVPVG